MGKFGKILFGLGKNQNLASPKTFPLQRQCIDVEAVVNHLRCVRFGVPVFELQTYRKRYVVATAVRVNHSGIESFYKCN